MSGLRKLAEHQPCYARLFPFCRPETGNVVLAHMRVGGNAGTGLKPPDVCGFPACNWCHAVIDGKTKQDIYTQEQLKAECHRAQNQWLEFLWKNEIIIVVVAA
jgi:hypothetical protein